MVSVATGNLRRRFPTIEPARIETVVQQRVREWCARARIKHFVGIIAERDARNELTDRRLSARD